MEKKRILIIENSIHVTGALNSVLRTSIALRGKYDFIFVLPLRSKASAIVKENDFQVFEIPMLELSKRWKSILLYVPNLIRSAYRVRRIAKDHQISIVHVNDFYNLIMPLWRLCGGSVRYVCHVNFVPDRFPTLLRKLWITSHLRFSGKIITVSNHVLQQLPAGNKSVCISNALPPEPEFDFENPEKRKVLLVVGNFMEGKGQDLAIQSFALIANAYPDWRLRLVGGDMGLNKNKTYLTQLHNLSKDLGMDHHVEWSGFSDAVGKEYHTASIALNFSMSESFSLTVQEAMFYGCPVIATRSGGPEELIEDKYSGLLVPVNDVAGMSWAMRDLIESYDMRLRLTSNAFKSIREKCSKANTVDRLNLVYQNILDY